MIAAHEDLPRASIPASRDFEPPRGSASVHLDALRGLAAISVMFAHWWDAFYANYDSLPSRNPLLVVPYLYCSFGHAWVIVFFVLSGYLVGGSVLRARRDGRWSWRSYLITRCTRLYVVLVPALLLGGALDWAGMHQTGAETIYSGHSGMGAFYFNAYPNLTLKAFGDCLLFLDVKAAPGFGSNGPLWSLPHEFWYYMGFPLLVIALSKRGHLWTRMGSGVGFLAWAAFVGGYKLVLFPVWLAGVVILFLPSLPKRSPWNEPLIRRFAIVLSFVVLLVGFVLKARGVLFPDTHLTIGRSHWHPPISDLLLTPAVVLLIWVLLHCATGPLRASYVWLAQRAANSSYTVYLVHFPAIIFLKAFFHLPRAVPSWQILPFNLTLLVIVFLYAQAVYFIFERNTDRVRKWIKPYVKGKSDSQGIKSKAN